MRIASEIFDPFSVKGKYMRAFADAWPDAEFVQEVLAQLSWYHPLVLPNKLPGPETRCWYAAQVECSGDNMQISVVEQMILECYSQLELMP